MCPFVSVAGVRWGLAFWSVRFQLWMRRQILYSCAGWHLQAVTLNYVSICPFLCPWPLLDGDWRSAERYKLVLCNTNWYSVVQTGTL